MLDAGIELGSFVGSRKLRYELPSFGPRDYPGAFLRVVEGVRA